MMEEQQVLGTELKLQRGFGAHISFAIVILLVALAVGCIWMAVALSSNNSDLNYQRQLANEYAKIIDDVASVSKDANLRMALAYRKNIAQAKAAQFREGTFVDTVRYMIQQPASKSDTSSSSQDLP